MRGGHKASAIRLLMKVEEMVASEGPVDPFKLNQLGKSIKEKLEDTCIKVLDAKVLTLVGEEELEGEIAQADLFKERVLSTVILNERASGRASQSNTVNSAAPLTTAGMIVSTQARGSRARLPKLTIKLFSGKLMEWTPVWDSFNSTIHTSPELSKVDKFNYLRSLVSNDALEAISWLTLTDANYDEAIEILQTRFGNKQLIVNKHMEQLLAIEGVISQHDTKGLRYLYDVVESNVRSLKSLGVSAES